MANNAKLAILRAKIEGVVTDLMLKTNAEHVYVDDTTTLAAKLATLAAQSDVTALQQAIDALGALAKKDKVSYADLDSALATLIDGKADKTALDAESERAMIAEQELSTRVTDLETTAGQNTEYIQAVDQRVGYIEPFANAVPALEEKVDGLIDGDTGKSIRTIANEELAAQLIGENAQESLDTLEEIATWIQNHPGDASAMNAAITALQNKVDTGDKNVSVYVSDAIAALNIGDYALAADLTALAGRVTAAEGKITAAEGKIAALEGTVNGLGAMATKDIVSESDLAAELKEKVNTAAEGNHSHANKALLDTYTQTEADLADAVAKKHEHANKSVIDGISAANVASWIGKAKVYSAGETVNLADNEIYVQLV